jgi:uncharacterized membrane protein YhaH (DUF805 family)
MLRFLFSPYGRVSRKSYWLNWILPYALILTGAVVIDAVFFPIAPGEDDPERLAQSILSLILFWPSIAIATKRLHDRGLTGWWNLASFLAVIVIAVVTYLSLVARTDLMADPFNAWAGVVASAASVAIILYVLIQTLFLRGQPGPNKYGPDPLGDQADTFN